MLTNDVWRSKVKRYMLLKTPLDKNSQAFLEVCMPFIKKDQRLKIRFFFVDPKAFPKAFSNESEPIKTLLTALHLPFQESPCKTYLLLTCHKRYREVLNKIAHP